MHRGPLQGGYLKARTVAPYSSEPPVFNESNIRMISRRLQKQIFGQQTSYEHAKLPKHLLDNLREHKIDIHRASDQLGSPDLNLTLPSLEGKNIDEHFRAIAVEQSKDYVVLADRLLNWNAPEPPQRWCFQPGWTR